MSAPDPVTVNVPLDSDALPVTPTAPRSEVSHGAGNTCGGGVAPDPSFSGSVFVSLSRGPGGAEKYVSGLSTISSTMAPSSRCCTRTVCVPVVSKKMLAPATPHPLSAHPHPAIDGSLVPACSTTSAELVVSTRQAGEPTESWEPVNWTCTESLLNELFCALKRTHRW